MSLPPRNDLTDISEYNEPKKQDDSNVFNQTDKIQLTTKRLTQSKNEGYLSKNQIETLYKIIFEPYLKTQTDIYGKRVESTKQSFLYNNAKLQLS